MTNKKIKLLFSSVIAIILVLLVCFSSSSLRNKINNQWDTYTIKISGIIRNFYLLYIAIDEAPGVGPGNTQISVKDPEHFSFVVLGDTQNFELPESSGSFVKAVKQVEKIKPTLVMTVGDLVQSCGYTIKCVDYKLWKNIAKPILPITYEVQGNHDRIVSNSDDSRKEQADKEWQSYFNLPTNGPAGFEEFTYSFDVGNSHFIVLDTEKPLEHEIGQDQLDWLEKDLAANQKENTFVFYHEPAFPMSYKIKQSLDVHKDMRDALWTILDKYNVTAVFNGHEHIYSRQQIDQDEFSAEKNGIYQFIIGNTDAYEKSKVTISDKVDYYHQGYDFVRVDVNGKEITVKLFSVDGDLIDSFTFSK